MKILLLADARSTHFHRWFLRLAALGHDVHVASARPIEMPGITMHALPHRGPFTLRVFHSAWHLYRLLKRLKPDIVHAHHIVEYGFIAALAGARSLVCTAMGSDVLMGMSSLKRRLLAGYACRRADHVIVRAEHMRRAAESLGATRITAIPNGIELSRFTDTNSAVVAERGPTILCARNFKPVYNVAAVIEALGLLRSRGLPFRATITGDGDGRVAAMRRLAELGLVDDVVLPGAVLPQSMPDLYRAHRIYVSPSLSDGNSVALMEAMASGCFPVVSDIPANRGWIHHGENGYLFAATDVAQLADQLAMALAKPALWRDAADQNRHLVEGRADFDLCLLQVLDVYQSVIDKAGAALRPQR